MTDNKPHGASNVTDAIITAERALAMAPLGCGVILTPRVVRLLLDAAKAAVAEGGHANG